MKSVRIIPRLDIKGPNLVKGIHLEGLRALGSPDFFAENYYHLGADELFYQDTVASLYGRNSLNDFITKAAKNIFIPLTVGGGLRTLEDIHAVLRAGADKVSINSAAVQDPSFINKASKVFGSSTIVISLEVIKVDEEYLIYTDSGREYTGVKLIDWAIEAQDRGAGEFFLTSIDNEGTGKGYDIDLIRMLSDAVEIPVIAHGGAGNLDHIFEAIIDGRADAISISSLLHYSMIKEHENKIENKISLSEGNSEFIKNKKTFKNFQNHSIRKIKDYLLKKEINVRT